MTWTPVTVTNPTRGSRTLPVRKAATGVQVSADLAHARVRVSVMGSEDEKAKSLAGLESAARFQRSQLARELSLRVTPELRFELDRGLEHAQRIDRMLRDLKEDAG